MHEIWENISRKQERLLRITVNCDFLQFSCQCVGTILIHHGHYASRDLPRILVLLFLWAQPRHKWVQSSKWGTTEAQLPNWVQSPKWGTTAKHWLFSIVCFLKKEFDVQLLCHFCNALIDQSHLGHHAKVEQANKQFLWETFHSCLVGLTNFQGPTEVKRSKVRPNHEYWWLLKLYFLSFAIFTSYWN